MKKIFTLISAALLASATAGFAQTILFQDFESATLPALPAGWTQQTKATTGWKTNSGIIKSNNDRWTLPAHTKYAVVDDWNNNEDNDSTLLISPSFSLVGHPNAYVALDYYFILASYGGNPIESAYLRVSTDGGTVWTSIDTLEGNPDTWQYAFKSLAAYAGQSNVKIGLQYSDGKGGAKMLPGLAVDYIKVFDPVPNDIRLVDINPLPGSGKAYGAAGGNISLGGTVINYGSSTISSFNASFQEGTSTPVSSTISGMNILQFGVQAFTCPNPLVLPSTIGTYPVKLWINLSGDLDVANDSGNTTVVVVPFKPAKKIFVEEATGTWCGFCPRGAVYMDSLAHNYSSSFTLAAVHNRDPMVNTTYDNFMGVALKGKGYPGVIVDRRDILDPSDLIDVYNAQKDNFGFAEITLADQGAPSFNLSIKVSVKPAIDLSGDYRLALVLTEDDVHGTGSGWGQVNYYSNTLAYGVLKGAGFDWNAEASTVPGDKIKYDFVARSIVPAPTGAIGSLPATMTAGTTYEYTFNTETHGSWNRTNMKAIAILIRNSDGMVLNSNDMVVPLGIKNVDAGIKRMNVYPNPANELTHLVFNLSESTKVKVQLMNAIGQVINTVADQQYSTGEHQIDINTSALAAGIYTIKLQTEKGMLTQQLSVVK